MTTKGKAYDEALERARDYYKANLKLDKADENLVLENIFPELAGSDDGETKKSLMQYIWNIYHREYCPPTPSIETCDKWLAWLEKQAASIDVDFILNKVSIKPAYKDGNAWCILYGDNLQDGICGFGDTKEDALAEFIKELLEKQGETYNNIKWKVWLEKQGEQETDEWKEGNIIRHGGVLALVIKGRRAMKSNGEIFTIQYPDEWVKAAPNEIEHFLNELENRGEKSQGKTALEAINEEKVDNANKDKVS